MTKAEIYKMLAENELLIERIEKALDFKESEIGAKTFTDLFGDGGFWMPETESIRTELQKRLVNTKIKYMSELKKIIIDCNKEMLKLGKE